MWYELIFVVCADTTIIRTVFSFVICIYISIPIASVVNVIIIYISHAVISRSTIASSEELTEVTVCRIVGNSFLVTHIAKLRTSIELIHVTIADGCADAAGNWLCGIDSATKETCNVGSIDEPCDIAIHLLHTGTCHLTESPTVNVTFCILRILIRCRLINSGEVEVGIVTACNINRHFRRFSCILRMATIRKILEPCIAANKNIIGVFSIGIHS